MGSPATLSPPPPPPPPQQLVASATFPASNAPPAAAGGASEAGAGGLSVASASTYMPTPRFLRRSTVHVACGDTQFRGSSTVTCSAASSPGGAGKAAGSPQRT